MSLNQQNMTVRRWLAGAAFALLASAASTRATTYNWVPTTSGNWMWNSGTNWGTGDNTFPNLAGDVANINSNVGGGFHTVRLGAPIVVGSLTLGDSDGSQAITVNNSNSGGTATPANTLTFQPAVAGGDAFLNLSAAGTVQNSITSDLFVGGTSTLNLNALGGQTLTTQTGVVTVGTGSALVMTGGVANTATWVISGDLAGAGTLTLSGLGGATVSGTKTFTGTIVLNRGVSGSSNAGTLTVTSGSVKDAAEIVINGYLTGSASGPTSAIQNGGSLQAGNGAGAATNPGQRIGQNIITLNGGSLTAGGQVATVGTANDWQKGLEFHSESITSLNFKSGGSLLSTSFSSTTQGYKLTIGTLARGAGATGFIRGNGLGNTTLQVSAGNGASLLKGAGGSNGTTTMSIIPWLVADGGSSSTSEPNTFATIDSSTGLIRQLTTGTTSESATTVGAGSTANVNVSALTMANDTTVNSLRFNASGSSNITNTQSGGIGKTLTVTSGGVFMSGDGGTIGTTGAANAGTMAFGSAEAVVWSLDANTNTIGAAITGGGGLTKAGTGKLVLTGNNSGLSGDINVSGGTLTVSGASGSSSPLSNANIVRVHAGATLQLSTDEGVRDGADLRLESNGLYFGKVVLDADVNETISALFLNGTAFAVGTYTSSNMAGLENYITFGNSGASLTVTAVPEPGTLSALSLAGLGLLRRRRRMA